MSSIMPKAALFLLSLQHPSTVAALVVAKPNLAANNLNFAHIFGNDIDMGYKAWKDFGELSLNKKTLSVTTGEFFHEHDHKLNLTTEVQNVLISNESGDTIIGRVVLLVLLKLNQEYVEQGGYTGNTKFIRREGVQEALDVLTNLLAAEMRLKAFENKSAVWTGGNGIETLISNHKDVELIPINCTISFRLVGTIGDLLKNKAYKGKGLLTKFALWSDLSKAYARNCRGEWVHAFLNIGMYQFENKEIGDIRSWKVPDYNSSLTQKVMFAVELPAILEMWDNGKGSLIKNGVKFVGVAGNTGIEDSDAEYLAKDQSYANSLVRLAAGEVRFGSDFMERAKKMALLQQVKVAIRTILANNHYDKEFPKHLIMSNGSTYKASDVKEDELKNIYQTFVAEQNLCWNQKKVKVDAKDLLHKQAQVAVAVLAAWHKLTPELKEKPDSEIPRILHNE